MAVIVSDCYEPDDQKRFLEGLASLDAECAKRYGKKSFMKLSPAQRTEFLTALDKERREYQKNKKKEDKNHYFQTIKDLVLWGYFTSEIGATQALRFVEYPGKYTTVDYKKGDRAWGGEFGGYRVVGLQGYKVVLRVVFCRCQRIYATL